MKTAMKRLLSFVLVAMMLVSVVPFQASAAGGTFTIVFADGSTVVEDLTVHGSDVCVGGFFKANGDTVEGKTKNDLNALGVETVYQTGCKIPFTVTIAGIIGGGTKTKTVDMTLPFTKSEVDASLTSQINTFMAEVPDYNTLYDGIGVTSVTMADQTATVTVTPKAEVAWSIVVNLNGTVKHTATANFRVAPTKDTEELKAAVKEVTDKVDLTKDTFAVGEWSIDETNKRASVNVTTTAIPPVSNEFQVTFVYCDEDDCDVCKEEGKCTSVTRTTVNQKLKTGDVPGIPDRYGYSFDYWRNDSNGGKGLVDTYTSDVTYTAVYKKDADSNLHKLKVFGVTYNHGKTNILSTPLATIYVKDEADLLTALQSKTTAIQNELNARGYTKANKYTWDGVTFYDDSDMGSDDKVKTGTETTGNGNFYIKVEYTGNNKVQLYIHTSKTLSIKDTVTLTTYAPGETISKSQITTAVKNDGWSYGTIRTYTQESWEKIVDRDSSSAADETKSFEVVEGETEIHVYLTGASSSSTNKSDNPKTGDTILMAVTVLGLSASALAAVYFISKKKRSV